MRTTAVALFLVVAAACAEKPAARRADSPAVTTVQQGDIALGAGEARLAVDGGRIWYKKSGSGTAAPVILLHGGPDTRATTSSPSRHLATSDPSCATTNSAAAKRIV